MNVLLDGLHTIVITVVALFPIVNPVGAIPVFLTMTEDVPKPERREQTLKAVIYLFFILSAFLIAGNSIMSFFGISIPAIRIAGGLILYGLGFNMLRAQPKYKQSKQEEAEVQEKDDISFTPLAMPILSGPGAIAVTLGLTSRAEHPVDFVFMTGGVLAIAIISFVLLRASTQISKIMGINGMNVLTRMMGFITISISIQFMIVGVKSVMAG